MKAVLTIAGSDTIGGAGIQADIKTMIMNGVYGMSAVTALTAQNTTGIKSIQEVSPQFLADQLDMILCDILPDAVKIGMVPSGALVEVIAEKLAQYGVKNIVVDPVMAATSGRSLIKTEAVAALTEGLLTMAAVVTPNIPEAEVLAGMTIGSEGEMKAAAQAIGEKCGCAVLVKGGHRSGSADDLLYSGGFTWFRGRRIDMPNAHGTGCTLSSAIAANLAKGFSLETAVKRAKDYVTGALAARLDLGHGSELLGHGVGLRGEFG